MLAASFGLSTSCIANSCGSIMEKLAWPQYSPYGIVAILDAYGISSASCMVILGVDGVIVLQE